MNEIHDNRILALYILAQQDEAAAVNYNQKLAIEQLKEHALKGNTDAEAALHRLKNLPYIHPFLKEVLAA
jgi:predicted transport protein